MDSAPAKLTPGPIGGPVGTAAPRLKPVGGAPDCPQCRQPMQPLPLEGHYGQQVPTDLCPHCHLVWFDEFESVRLSGLGWVRLLRRMHAAQAQAPAATARPLACPRCDAGLVPVQNQTRFGRFVALECPRRHGHLHGFSLLLAERGLVRPLSHIDLRALAKEGREPTCLNCGGGLTPGAERCTYCDSPLLVIDLPRLMSALLVRHAEPLPATAGEHLAWPCRGCGAPLDPARSTRCDSCLHPVVIPSVVDLRPLLDEVEPLLRGAQPRAARPHGERLRKLRGDHRATTVHRVWQALFGEDGASQPLAWAAALLFLLGWWLFG
jgi:hypothetical protein